MSNDLDERFAEALGAAADNVVISSGARREAHARRSPSRSRRSVYAVAASAAAVVAIAVAGSLVAAHREAAPVPSGPASTALIATPLSLEGGAALLEPCLQQERNVPPEASPAAAALSDRWTIDAVFEIHLGTTRAEINLDPDNKQTLRLLPDEAPDVFPVVLAHAADGTRADCGSPHGSGFRPASLSDPAYVPGYAQSTGATGYVVWGTYAQGASRVTVTIGGREREASLSHGYFAAVGSFDPADVGVPRPLGWGTAGQVVTAYAADGSVLSQEDQPESAVVARHSCWRRPDGSPLQVSKNVAAYAKGTVSSSCGTALPLGR